MSNDELERHRRMFKDLLHAHGGYDRYIGHLKEKNRYRGVQDDYLIFTDFTSRSDPCSWVNGASTWSRTAEGADYWRRIHRELNMTISGERTKQPACNSIW